MARKPKTAPPVWPSAAIQIAYQSDLRNTLIKPMAADLLAVLRAAWVTVEVAADARPPANRLRTVMERWGKKWTARLETLAEKMARQFADASRAYTDRAVKRSFKEAGLTIQWRPTKRMLEGYAAVVYENVQLIKSIPAKFLGDVQSDVWLSVTKGADMAALTEKIKGAYGVTWRRAALISRDQTAKARGVFEAARRSELGIKRAVWMHSHAGREPRPSHVAMNGKEFDVAKGMWDKDEGEFVQPGELINCRCVSRAVIPGFD